MKRSWLILSVGFGIVIALIALLGFGARHRAKTINDEMIAAHEKYLENEAVLNEIPAGLYQADILVRDAIQTMSGLVQDAEAVLETGKTTSAEVLADTDAIVQVLSNLIENGIKYGQARNASSCRVIVSAHEISEPADTVEFRVRDFGQGIASEHLSRIFERFYRVDKARSRESGGTGLGLAIARRILQAHGGTIRAESALNHGSTFIFTLPKRPVPNAGVEAAV